MIVEEDLRVMAEEAVEWRRALHRYPGTSFEEFYASDFVVSRLEEMGVEVHRGLGGTGVVGVIEGRGGGNRALGLRADMDGLDMEEENEVEWASCYEGKMHACGHDGHMAMLLCASNYLSKHRNFSGRCYVIFQPGEEGGVGARRMMDEGLFRRFPMESVWGLHCCPGMGVGEMSADSGVVLAATDDFRLKIRGRGGHASKPHLGCDSLVIGSHVIQGLQSWVSRFVDPLESVVVSVCRIEGGRAFNVIPEFVELEGTVRTLSRDMHDIVEEEFSRLVRGIVSMYGGDVEIEYERNTPPLYNGEEESAVAGEVARDILGASGVVVKGTEMGGEDFAFMLEEKPGCFVFLGNGFEGEKGGAGVHTTRFDFNDEALIWGAKYWVGLVEKVLGSEGFEER